MPPQAKTKSVEDEYPGRNLGKQGDALQSFYAGKGLHQ